MQMSRLLGKREKEGHRPSANDARKGGADVQHLFYHPSLQQTHHRKAYIKPTSYSCPRRSLPLSVSWPTSGFPLPFALFLSDARVPIMQASRNLGVPNKYGSCVSSYRCSCRSKLTSSPVPLPFSTNTFRSPLGSPQRTNSPLPGLSSSINAPPPLNLKVMRLSRPSLSHSSQPYLSSSLSAHPTTQAVQADLARSLESAPDDPTFPLSSLLALPGSFGTISLGETFTSSLSLSNDTALPVSYVRLRVELQTQASGSKATLCDVKPIGAEGRIEAGAALTELVVWEIKELGLHNLQCEVSWGIGEEEKSFKKVYK
jgi:hypothetical protein